MNTRGFFVALGLACLALGIGARSARADAWALLIGVNEYEDRNNISSLATADQDAIALKDLLIDTMKVPERHIDLLVTDPKAETPKPTRANIIEALVRLKNNVKPDDTVYVFFSGHGIQVGVADYLLPYDFRGSSPEAGVDTALAEARFYELLAQVRAKAVILAWDKCRNNPFSVKKSADGERNTLPDDTETKKGWVTVAADGKPIPAPKNAPPIIAKFFACSPGQSAYEWRAKGRGYFSYYFEKGLRGAAADKAGKVTVGSLKKYVETEVQAQVMRDESEEQTPYPQIEGPSADDFVLVGEGGDIPPTPETEIVAKRAVTPESAPPPDPKATFDPTKPLAPNVARIIVETNIPDLVATLNGSIEVSGISEVMFKGKRIVGVIHDFKVDKAIDIVLEATAPGYESRSWPLRLYGGVTTLARFPDPSLPPLVAPKRNVPESVTKLLGAHKIDALAALGALKFQIDPPRFRKTRPFPVYTLVGALDLSTISPADDEPGKTPRGRPKRRPKNDNGNAGGVGAPNILLPFWQTLRTLREGSASYSQEGEALVVTTAAASWHIEMTKDGKIDRITGELDGKPLTVRLLKYQDFNGVPLPQKIQTEFNGKTGIFTVKRVEKA